MCNQHRQRTLARRLKDAESGQVLVWYALMLVALVALAGLVIDLGLVFVERQRLQAIADESALAGAMELNLLILANAKNCFQVNCLTAPTKARERCSDYGIDSADCQIEVRAMPCRSDALSGVCAIAGIGGNSVTVTVKGRVDTFFIHIVTGGDLIELSATATARMVHNF